MSEATREGTGTKSAPNYEESKRLAADKDPLVRADLAACPDIRPELLYFLAEDPSPEVRRKAALNEQTPLRANLILARDSDETVRRSIAGKVAQLLPYLGGRGKAQAERHVLETLELLARDQAIRVRRILAETLRDLTGAPPAVIRRLARDVDDVVACPVLEFSPLLSDEDLIEIIGEGCAQARLSAISRRHGLGETVADAIVGTEDREAVAALLANTSAQIREETLDALVDQARDVAAWHEPLVVRPKLSPGTIRKLAGFVAENLLRRLQNREELDGETARLVAEEVRRRVSEDAAAGSAEGSTPDGDTDQPDDDALLQALARGDRALVCDLLVRRSAMDQDAVERILSAGSAKGITALAWKAGLAMRLATQLQLRMGGIPPGDVLHARDGVDYPLTNDEMTWQLDFFRTLSG